MLRSARSTCPSPPIKSCPGPVCDPTRDLDFHALGPKLVLHNKSLHSQGLWVLPGRTSASKSTNTILIVRTAFFLDNARYPNSQSGNTVAMAHDPAQRGRPAILSTVPKFVSCVLAYPAVIPPPSHPWRLRTLKIAYIAILAVCRSWRRLPNTKTLLPLLRIIRAGPTPACGMTRAPSGCTKGAAGVQAWRTARSCRPRPSVARDPWTIPARGVTSLRLGFPEWSCRPWVELMHWADLEMQAEAFGVNLMSTQQMSVPITPTRVGTTRSPADQRCP